MRLHFFCNGSAAHLGKSTTVKSEYPYLRPFIHHSSPSSDLFGATRSRHSSSAMRAGDRGRRVFSSFCVISRHHDADDQPFRSSLCTFQPGGYVYTLTLQTFN